MSLTRRRFTQILASTLFLHHLPSFAQSVKFWASLTLPEAQNIKTKRGGTYALTLLYIEQCHYVHKIGIALFSPRNAPHSTVYAFIFFYQRRF